MSLVSLPTSIRVSAAKRVASQRSLHTTSSARASVLFALGALSNSRETAHFNKISGLPRYEHSPPLKIIKTSEVDAHPLPTPSRPAISSNAWLSTRSASVLQAWDEKALKIGRIVLSDQARQVNRMRHAMEGAKRRQAKSDAMLKRERLLWRSERSRLQKDMRSAVFWILASIGTATCLAAWRFFPGASSRTDTTDMGRKIAARAATAMPLPAAVVTSDPATKSSAMPSSAVAPKDRPAPMAAAVTKSKPQPPAYSWMKGLLWKQTSS